MIKFLLGLLSIFSLELMSPPCIVAADATASPPGEVEEALSPPEDQYEEYRLLEILEKHTEIATKRRLNADFVPGMVTVLYGDDLAARGVRTLIEALNLVPGMDTYLLRQGFWLTAVRGGTEPLAVGNLKILLDDIPVNTAFGTDPVPNIPVAQVERIDVIRGPGSAIHGEFASAGVVNIITRKKENLIYTNLGSFDTYGGGAVFSLADPVRDLDMSVNVAGGKSAGPQMETGPDTLYGRGMANISYAPGPTNEMNEYESAFLALAYKNFSLNGQLLANEQGDYFGLSYALPPPDDRGIYSSSAHGLEVRQKVTFFSFLPAELSLGWQQQKFEVNDSYLYPPGYYLYLPSGDQLIYPDGWIYSLYFEEELFRGGVDFTWTAWDRHDLLLGYSFHQKKTDDVWVETNFYTGLSIPLPMEKTRLNGSEIGFLGGRKRDIHSVTVQDAFRLSERLTLTGSLRYDHYSDIDFALSPRLAAVYQFNDRHVFKSQYAKAFRPPSFWEMYSSNNPIGAGNPDLEAMTNETFETGYIYKNLNTVLRATLFYSELDNVIYIQDSVWENADPNHYWGAELELEQQIWRILKIDANLSHVHTPAVNTVSEGVQSASWLGNMGLLYQSSRFLNFALQYRYVGERGREQSDPRADLHASHTVDLTGSLFDAGIKGLTFRAGIKNIFNEDVRHPAPMEEFDPYGNKYPSYTEDLPRPGRHWWCHVSWAW